MIGARFAVLVVVAAACGAPAYPPVAPPGPPGPAVDYAVLAERIVGDSAAVREGELVQVQGTPADRPLMDALAIAVRRRGAFPLLTLTSEELSRQLYAQVPERYDGQAPLLDLALAEIVSVIIDLVPESDEVYAGVPPERIARAFEARQGLHARQRARGVRQVSVGNEVYPSQARATHYAVPYATLARNYVRGIAVDAATIAGRGAWLREKLAGARRVEVTNPNGTHVTMSLVGRKVLLNDGILTPAKLAARGAEVEVWLPAGELFAAPVPTSVEGTIVVDRMLFQDTQIEGLRVELAGGKVARITARTGLAAIQRFYDAAGAGKEWFSALDLGINPNVEIVPGAWLNASVAAGMITMGIGGNAWAGGDNDLSFGILLYVPGSTLLVDGEPMIVAGQLALPAGVR